MKKKRQKVGLGPDAEIANIHAIMRKTEALQRAAIQRSQTDRAALFALADAAIEWLELVEEAFPPDPKYPAPKYHDPFDKAEEAVMSAARLVRQRGWKKSTVSKFSKQNARRRKA